MMISKHFIFVLSILFVSDVYAKVLTVPFQSITLKPNQTIQANFEFGPHNIIFCFENNETDVGQITWPYKGNLQNAKLPVLLKTKSNFEGQFSDPSGTLSILNTQTKNMLVSCVFGY